MAHNEHAVSLSLQLYDMICRSGCLIIICQRLIINRYMSRTLDQSKERKSLLLVIRRDQKVTYDYRAESFNDITV